MPTHPLFAETVPFIRRAVVRHWRKGACACTAVCLLALVGTLLMPRTFQSEARLFVRFGRENQVDLTAAGGPMVALYESRESEINSLIEILKSRAILDRVVNELGPDYVLKGKANGVHQASANLPGTAAARTPAVPSAAHQQAVQALEKMVSIAAPRKSNIITVVCQAPAPDVAQQIAAKLVAVYLDEYLRVHLTPGSYEIFAEQARVSQAAWKAAADRLKDAKNRLSIVTIDGKRKELELLLAEARGKLLLNEADRKSATGKIKALEDKIDALPASIVTQEVASPSASLDGQRRSLSLLEAQEHELAAKMQDSHPKLAALRQQVADLRAILEAQPAEPKSAAKTLNPARQSLELALLNERAQAAALAAKERSLVKQQQELSADLAALNSGVQEIEQLQQQVSLAESNYKDYAQRLEQARINRSLDEERISSLSLVQPASYATQPSGPRRALVLAAGVLLAGASGIATILLAAWLKPVVTTAEQLALLLDLPVLGGPNRQTLPAAA